MFVANIEEMQMRESQLHASRRERAERRGEDDDESSGSGSESGSDQIVDATIDREEAVARMAEARRTRSDQTTAVVADASQEEATMGSLLSGMKSVNPNSNRGGKVEFSAKDLIDAEMVDQEARMSRREREALEAQRRKDEYMRRHLAGETEAAKSDLDRLAIVRRRREEARLKAEAEGRAPGMSSYGIASDDDEDEEGGKASVKSDLAKATSGVADMAVSESVAKKRAAALAEAAAPSSEEALPKLKSMDIKKMNGDALKEALKARGLNVQGQKKDLIQRLIDYEATRK
jgi:hypothetical protein